MRLERATAYAILAMAYLSESDAGSPQQVHMISKETGVPVEYLRKLMGRLARARLISSTRGRHGGFRLSKARKNITVLEVVEAIEGPVDAQSVLDDDLVRTRKDKSGKLLDRWRQSTGQRLRELLQATNLAEIGPQ